MQNQPQFDVVGPTADDDIRRVIRRYGADEVKEAVKRHTARPRGRRPEADWAEILDVLREDARSWLEGLDPYSARSNLSIARNFAERHAGQSYEATHRRIMKKLAARRRYYILAEAEWLSQREYPYTSNLRAMRELQELGIRRDLWGSLLHLREASLADYRSKFGEPSADMTMEEVLEGAAKPIAASPGPGNVLQILLGAAR